MGVLRDGGQWFFLYRLAVRSADGNIYIARDDRGGVFLLHPIRISGCRNGNCGIAVLLTWMAFRQFVTTNVVYDVDEFGELHYITTYGQEYTNILLAGSGTVLAVP